MRPRRDLNRYLSAPVSLILVVGCLALPAGGCGSLANHGPTPELSPQQSR